MMALALYRGVTTAAAPLIGPYLRARLRRGKEDAARLPERYGIASVPRPDGPVIWIHAASVGESLSMLPVLDRLSTEWKDVRIVITTGTVTSARILADRLPSTAVHQFVPLDRAAWARRFLDHWRPDLALWVESEFWPNLLRETARRKVPLVLLNARISPRSFRGWQRFRGTIGTLLGCFDLCMAQSEDEARRLGALGAANVRAPGNLKLAAPPLPNDTAELARLQSMIGGRPVWLASSTHPGEDETVGAAHDRLRGNIGGLLTIVVPRHAERGPSIADLLGGRGLRVALRSRGDPITGETDIYVADTMGELGLFYRLAEVVFVGGSLIPHGGQNLLEPARLDCAVLHGPHMENFPVITREFAEAGAAATVTNADELAEAVRALLTEEAARRERMEAGRKVAGQKAEILDAVFELLEPYLSATAPKNAHEDKPAVSDARA